MVKKYIVIEALDESNARVKELEKFIAKFLEYDINDRYIGDIECKSDYIVLINDAPVESFIDNISSTLQSLTLSGVETLHYKNAQYSMTITVFGWDVESECGTYKKFELVNSTKEEELEVDYMLSYSYSEENEKKEFLEEITYNSHIPEEIRQEYLNYKLKLLGMSPKEECITNIDTMDISREDLIELVFNLKDKVFKLEEELKEVKEKLDEEEF